jgi:RimJ/RimL family protein N-acetyltransferase
MDMANWQCLPTITASRVSLRWITDRDIDSLYLIFSDPEVMRYWSSPPLKTREAAEELLAEIHEGFRRRLIFQWGIARRADDKIIGTSTLFHIESNNYRAEVGYALGRAHWGKGYMQEALRALLGYAFCEMKLERIEADVDPRNGASIRTLERLGFEKEGYLRERWKVNGEVQDAIIYGLLKREWEGVARPGYNRKWGINP